MRNFATPPSITRFVVLSARDGVRVASTRFCRKTLFFPPYCKRDKFRTFLLNQQIHSERNPRQTLNFHSSHSFLPVVSWCGSVVIQLDFFTRMRPRMSLFLVEGCPSPASTHTCTGHSSNPTTVSQRLHRKIRRTSPNWGSQGCSTFFS